MSPSGSPNRGTALLLDDHFLLHILRLTYHYKCPLVALDLWPRCPTTEWRPLEGLNVEAGNGELLLVRQNRHFGRLARVPHHFPWDIGVLEIG